MKRVLLMGFCVLFLSVAGPVRSASAGIRIWHRHHKDAAKTNAKDADKSSRKHAAKSSKKDAAKSSAEPEAKAKHRKISFHRHSDSSREQAAHKEATYGMTGPKTVGWLNPRPGPAGVGAN